MNRLTATGFVLVLIGAVVPFLMVLGVLPSALWLSFVAYTASITGLCMGVIGAASIARARWRHRDPDG